MFVGLFSNVMYMEASFFLLLLAVWKNYLIYINMKFLGNLNNKKIRIETHVFLFFDLDVMGILKFG